MGSVRLHVGILTLNPSRWNRALSKLEQLDRTAPVAWPCSVVSLDTRPPKLQPVFLLWTRCARPQVGRVAERVQTVQEVSEAPGQIRSSRLGRRVPIARRRASSARTAWDPITLPIHLVVEQKHQQNHKQEHLHHVAWAKMPVEQKHQQNHKQEHLHHVAWAKMPADIANIIMTQPSDLDRS